MLEIFSSICNLFEEFQPSSPILGRPPVSNFPMASSSLPRAFFNCATQNGVCGCGFHIQADENCLLFAHWNRGRGSNLMAEAMALTGLLSFYLFLNLQDISFYGDSKVLVDYMAGKISISRPHLEGWLNRIRFY